MVIKIFKSQTQHANDILLQRDVMSELCLFCTKHPDPCRCDINNPGQKAWPTVDGPLCVSTLKRGRPDGFCDAMLGDTFTYQLGMTVVLVRVLWHGHVLESSRNTVTPHGDRRPACTSWEQLNGPLTKNGIYSITVCKITTREYEYLRVKPGGKQQICRVHTTYFDHRLFQSLACVTGQRDWDHSSHRGFLYKLYSEGQRQHSDGRWLEALGLQGVLYSCSVCHYSSSHQVGMTNSSQGPQNLQLDQKHSLYCTAGQQARTHFTAL